MHPRPPIVTQNLLPFFIHEVGRNWHRHSARLQDILLGRAPQPIRLRDDTTVVHAYYEICILVENQRQSLRTETRIMARSSSRLDWVLMITRVVGSSTVWYCIMCVQCTWGALSFRI